MINAELGHVKNVKEFYDEIRKQQEKAHGDHYCGMHEAIKKYWDLGKCKEYMELGTHQGGSASLAMQLPDINQIQLIDIDMSRYRKVLAPLAAKHCAQNNIKLIVKEMDSRSLGAIGRCDMLVIDSVHHPEFIKQELDIHGHNARKYIIAHDTYRIMGNVNPRLHVALEEFAKNRGWKVLEHNMKNVGYTVLGK